MTKFRRQLEKGTNDLLAAVDAIANRNNLSPIGPWRAQYDWSTAYIEQFNERFNQLVIAHGIGAVDTAEVIQGHTVAPLFLFGNSMTSPAIPSM